MTIQFREWTFEVDKQTTEKVYKAVESSAAQECGCTYCQNFLLQQDTIYPLEVIKLFELVGIDYHKESDASEYGELDNGLRIYITSFHFAGKILTGESSASVLPTGGYQLNLTPINERVKIGFWENNELSYFTSETALVQIELEIHLPWVLNVEAENSLG